MSKGDRPVNISWTLQGHPISSYPGISASMMNERSSVLSIMKILNVHNGDYTCFASNAAGNSSYTATLRVNGNSYVFIAVLLFSPIFYPVSSTLVTRSVQIFYLNFVQSFPILLLSKSTKTSMSVTAYSLIAMYPRVISLSQFRGNSTEKPFLHLVLA